MVGRGQLKCGELLLVLSKFNPVKVVLLFTDFILKGISNVEWYRPGEEWLLKGGGPRALQQCSGGPRRPRASGIKSNVASRSRAVTVLLHSTLERPHLECCIHPLLGPSLQQGVGSWPEERN